MAGEVTRRASSGERLHSWKEIATYLGVSVRTAQLWEGTRGLPVRRPAGPRSSVYAFRKELDDWMKSAGDDLERAQRESRRRRTAILGAGLTAAVIALAGMGAGIWLHVRTLLAAPAVLRVEGAALVALDSGGKELWRRLLEPPRELGEAMLGENGVLAVKAEYPATDGPEVVAVERWETGAISPSSRLAHFFISGFGRGGQLLWRRRPEVELLDARGVRFIQDWDIHALVTAPSGGRLRVWVGLGHHTRFPGVVAEVLSDGRLRAVFANHGHVNSVAGTTAGGRQWLVVGGATNALRGAFLALIDPERGFSKAPEGGPERYRLASPAQSEPELYYHVPAFDLTEATFSDVNHIYLLETGPAGLVARVVVGGTAGCVLFLEFDPPLTPRVARISAACGLVHRQLEQRGVLNHSFDECPYFQRPVELRRWKPGEGWKNIQVPIATMKNQL